MSASLDEIAECLGAIAAEAGRLLAAVTDRAAGRRVKADGSSATAADLASEALIVARLHETWPNIPVVAEEGTAREGARAPGGDAFFLVDPLDGTRDYVDGSGEYAVNVALVRGTRPVAAALAAPARDVVWIAGTRAAGRSLSGAGAWRPVATRPAGGALVALVSRRHPDPAEERILAALPVSRRACLSSAAKFGAVACGEADLYLRCGPTMEWDTAAGDHIVTVAGGAVIGPDGGPLRYGRFAEGYLNGPFAACGDPALASALHLSGRRPGA